MDAGKEKTIRELKVVVHCEIYDYIASWLLDFFIK